MNKMSIDRRYGPKLSYVFTDIKIPFECSINKWNDILQPAFSKIKEEALEKHNWTIKQKDITLLFEGHSESGQYLNYCVFCILWEHDTSDWGF